MPKPLIDETGHIYGQLKVLSSIRRPNDRKTMWLCECQNCGSTIVCSGSDLRTGKRTSCGKHCNNIKNETGKKYGLLTVLCQDPTPAINFPDKSIHWICQCDCGSAPISVSGRCLRVGDTQSCGCLKSAGENLISEILNELGYLYQKEYSFSDLIGPSKTNKLRFDFAVFNTQNELLFLIEYNGEQHEKEVPYFKRPLNYYQNNDNLKQIYCKEHNIPLVIYTRIKGKLPQREDLKELIKQDYEEYSHEIFN